MTKKTQLFRAGEHWTEPRVPSYQRERERHRTCESAHNLRRRHHRYRSADQVRAGM